MAAAQAPPNRCRRPQNAERRGLIPALANIENDKVYIFTGTMDTTVNPVASAATRLLYTNLGVKADNLMYVDTVPAGHSYLTLDHGNPCPVTASPYIVDCDRDQAGNILEFLIGDLKPKATELTGQIIEFSQKEFSPKPEAISMADTGYVYVPKACAEGQPCKLHVAIHGCKQNAASIGMAYVTDTGYLPWADSNNIVILFPQTIARNDIALEVSIIPTPAGTGGATAATTTITPALAIRSPPSAAWWIAGRWALITGRIQKPEPQSLPENHHLSNRNEAENGKSHLHQVRNRWIPLEPICCEEDERRRQGSMAAAGGFPPDPKRRCQPDPQRRFRQTCQVRSGSGILELNVTCDRRITVS